MEAPPIEFGPLFEEVCLGNQAAVSLCHALLHWMNFIDDVVDGDKTYDLETATRGNLECAMVFAFNDFWLAHAEKLLPLIEQGAQAYLDSVSWALRPEDEHRRAANVLKSQYQEVFWYIARIVGGLDHYERMTAKYRAYQYDVV